MDPCARVELRELLVIRDHARRAIREGQSEAVDLLTEEDDLDGGHGLVNLGERLDDEVERTPRRSGSGHGQHDRAGRRRHIARVEEAEIQAQWDRAGRVPVAREQIP